MNFQNLHEDIEIEFILGYVYYLQSKDALLV